MERIKTVDGIRLVYRNIRRHTEKIKRIEEQIKQIQANACFAVTTHYGGVKVKQSRTDNTPQERYITDAYELKSNLLNEISRKAELENEYFIPVLNVLSPGVALVLFDYIDGVKVDKKALKNALYGVSSALRGNGCSPDESEQTEKNVINRNKQQQKKTKDNTIKKVVSSDEIEMIDRFGISPKSVNRAIYTIRCKCIERNRGGGSDVSRNTLYKEICTLENVYLYGNSLQDCDIDFIELYATGYLSAAAVLKEKERYISIVKTISRTLHNRL